MNTKITIRELSSQQRERLLRDNKFNQLKPVSCSECGNQTNFSRKIFEVKGKNLATDENTRNLACYHVQTTYNCEYVFFKTLKKRSYIDSAICDNCDSTKIVYDIELNDELWEKASKLLNIPSSSIKKDIESILKSRKNKLN
jgi:hypothetical protein